MNECKSIDLLNKVSNNEISYIGESSRPLRDRVWEHGQNLKNGSEKSFIISHWMDTHGHTLDAPVFEWKVMDAYTDALRRQVSEGLHIMEAGALNKKLEFNSNLICRMEVNSNCNITDEHLQKELSRRRLQCNKLREFIREKSYNTDVIVLKNNKKNPPNDTSTTNVLDCR